MSYMKRMLENSIGSMPDEELIRYGYTKEEINYMRESFMGRKEMDQNEKHNYGSN